MSCARSLQARSENENNLAQLLAMALNEVMRLDEHNQQLFSRSRRTKPTPSSIGVGKTYCAGGKRKRDEVESLNMDNVDNLDPKRRRARLLTTTNIRIAGQGRITLGKPIDFNVVHDVKEARSNPSGSSLWKKVVRTQHGRMCQSMLSACVIA
ncbi:uncharacterized protein LOC143460758 [Clavelina lepadiformis]|uniref:Neurotrophin-3 n=1 Tax=Clavelina lepadiformis TaxID=159417 RepID=A0ABP0GE22_CLALP